MILTVKQAWNALVNNGMPQNRATEFVAIGICESSLDSSAVSPVGAIGVWQVMPFNAAIGGGTPADLYDPDYNARVTVLLSGHGANCAAWDTAYANIGASGRYSFLNWPEPGSCAANNLGTASVAGGTDKTGGAIPPSQPSVSNGLDIALAVYASLAAHDLPQAHRRSDQYGVILGRMFTRGWRP